MAQMLDAIARGVSLSGSCIDDAAAFDLKLVMTAAPIAVELKYISCAR